MRDLIGYALYSFVGLVGIVIAFSIWGPEPAQRTTEPTTTTTTTTTVTTEVNEPEPAPMATPDDLRRLADSLDALGARLRSEADGDAIATTAEALERMMRTADALQRMYPARAE